MASLKKERRKYAHGTAERAAYDQISPERYAHGGFELEIEETKLTGSEERYVLHTRLRRISDLKPLQRIKLEKHLLLAANLYDAALAASGGQYSHELRDFVSRSRTFGETYRMDCIIDVSNIKALMHGTPDAGMLVTIFQTHRNKSLAEIYGGKASAKRAKRQLESMLAKIAIYYKLSE